MTRQLTAMIEREDDGYVALCPKLDIASQGETVAEARANLKEALELFFETASATELQERLPSEVVPDTESRRPADRNTVVNHQANATSQSAF